MIYTNYQQMERYLGVSDALDTAIRYLKTADLSQLQFGRNDVDGDNVYINRFDYDTLPLDKAAWTIRCRWTRPPGRDTPSMPTSTCCSAARRRSA